MEPADKSLRTASQPFGAMKFILGPLRYRVKIMDWIKMAQRKMPSRRAIVDYWAPRLLERGFIDSEFDLNTKTCFACGATCGGSRCHIRPKVLGGPDEVSNLHLLCHVCHRQSENLSGEEYWEWFKWVCDAPFESLCAGPRAVIPGKLIYSRVVGLATILGFKEAASRFGISI